MDQREPHAWLLEKLGTDYLPSSIWEALEDEGVLEYAEKIGSKEEYDDLLRAAKRYYRVWRDTGGDLGRRANDSPEDSLDECCEDLRPTTP